MIAPVSTVAFSIWLKARISTLSPMVTPGSEHDIGFDSDILAENGVEGEPDRLRIDQEWRRSRIAFARSRACMPRLRHRQFGARIDAERLLLSRLDHATGGARPCGRLRRCRSGNIRLWHFHCSILSRSGNSRAPSISMIPVVAQVYSPFGLVRIQRLDNALQRPVRSQAPAGHRAWAPEPACPARSPPRPAASRRIRARVSG